MHSHHHHREHQVSHRRVHHVLKHEPAGAKEHNHSHAFSKVTSKTAAEHHDGHVAGKRAPKRYARGGKVKGHKGHQTNIAIVNPPAKTAAPPMPAGPMPAAGVPARPMPPPGAAPPMAGPPPGPGGPMPMPPRARGGKVCSDGASSSKANLDAWASRASKNSYARGGSIKMTAGAATGVGREEQAHHMKKKGK